MISNKSIIITGPGCSGSTLQYNIVRLLLEYNNIKFNKTFVPIKNIDNKLYNKYDIILTKQFILDITRMPRSPYVIISRRNIKSIMSCCRRRWKNHTKNILIAAKKEINAFVTWRKYCETENIPFNIAHYELYMKDPKKFIDLVAHRLDVSCNSKLILHQLDQQKNDQNVEYTLLTDNNIGTKQVDDFSYITLKEQQLLEQHFPDWI